MSSFLEAFGNEPPVSIVVDGTEVKFPILTCESVATLISRIQASRRAKGKTLVPSADSKGNPLSAAEKTRILMEFEDEPSIGEVCNFVFTLTGATAVLDASLEQSGMPIVERANLLKKIPWKTKHSAALAVSGLFEKEGEKKNPNDGAGGANETGSEAISPASTSSPPLTPAS